MQKLLLVFLFSGIFFACKDEKKSLAGDSSVVIDDFFAGYINIKLPYDVADSNMNKIEETDTISRMVFSKFVPDTLISNSFKNEKIAIRPIGKFENKGEETYLLSHVRSNNRSVIFLSAFDKSKKYSASLPLITSNTDNSIFNSASVDKKLNISQNKEWKKDNDLLYNRVIYAYNNVGMFTVVMTETNDQSHLSNKINNPLDTLPKNNKYSGDYTKGKKSFLFLRDGKNAMTYLFYVRFENGDEDPCIGELKGEIVLRDETSATFTENADPCVVDFVFGKNQVKVKEQGSCGSHRGIKCFFDDTYIRKKQPATKK